MYRTNLLVSVMMLALVVGITMVPAMAASSVDNHQPPSLATGITLRDPVTLEPLQFLVGNADGSVGRTTQFFDSMLVGRADNLIGVATLGGYSGDRDLGDLFSGRIDLRSVAERVQPPVPGADEERWLSLEVTKARLRYATNLGRDCAYSMPGHFAPFVSYDHGKIFLIWDNGVLMFGAHSIDFAVKQGGRYNALTGVDARSFYIIAGKTPGLVSQEACQPAPPQQGAGWLSDASPQQGNYPMATPEPESNPSKGTTTAHKDAFTTATSKPPTAGDLRPVAQLFTAAATAAQAAQSAAPAGTSGFPLATDITASLGSAEEATLSAQARKEIAHFTRDKGYTGGLLEPGYYKSPLGDTRIVWYFAKAGALVEAPFYPFDTFTGTNGNLVIVGGGKLTPNPQYSASVCYLDNVWIGQTQRKMKGGDVIGLRNRANTEYIRYVRLVEGMTAVVPIRVNSDGTDTVDLRIMEGN